MNSHFTYLLIDIVVIAGPLLLSFDKKVAFFKRWLFLFPSILVSGALFIVWDIHYVQQGIWWFNEQYILGVNYLGLPIEEWIFFLMIPYACIFIYACLIAYLPSWRYRAKSIHLWTILGLFFLAMSIIHVQKTYTNQVFLGAGIMAIGVRLLRNKLIFFHPDIFLMMYFISLLPFLLVNGLLTSLPIVVYDDEEILSPRLMSIPWEDMPYGFLLMLISAIIMDWLMHGRKQSKLRSPVSQ